MTRKFIIFKTAAGTFFCLLGVILGINFISTPDKSEYLPGDEKLTTLTGYLTMEPQYQAGSGKNQSACFEIKLSGYPGVNFRNGGVYLRATQWKSAMTEIKTDDTVSIKVLKSDFEKLYLKRDEMGFFQQLANHPLDNFEFYSLKHKGKEYVTDLYSAALNDQNDNLFGRIMIAMGAFVFGIYCFVAKK